MYQLTKWRNELVRDKRAFKIQCFLSHGGVCSEVVVVMINPTIRSIARAKAWRKSFAWKGYQAEYKKIIGRIFFEILPWLQLFVCWQNLCPLTRTRAL